ncbi:MAG: DUF3990 domain-containing protein [Armatimonadetes bacterium]|nr:DUF3990 domain-containing protein [Armatimonadota bacterium]
MRKLEQPPRPWQHQCVRLYHGTLEEYVSDILSRIDLSVSKARTDFGRGFYTTTWLEQARRWAGQVAKEEGRRNSAARPAVVYFDLDRDALAALGSLVFVRRQWDAEDYWSLVWHCRAKGTHRPWDIEQPMHGVVAGPVAKDYRRRYAYSSYDQVSFHTPAAAQKLDNSPKGEVPWTISSFSTSTGRL